MGLYVIHCEKKNHGQTIFSSLNAELNHTNNNLPGFCDQASVIYKIHFFTDDNIIEKCKSTKQYI